MSKDKVVSLAAPAEVSDPLTDLLRSGARRLIEAAVTAEFEEYLGAFEDQQLADGRRRVVRNGHLPERQILTGIGAVDVQVPKARSRSGAVEPFRSALVPPYVRRSASVEAAVPWLYLHGVSTGKMRQAVAALVGEAAARGLSANVVSRLKRVWDEQYREWCRRPLDDAWVYLWADGIHSGLRGDDGRLCVLVVIGVNARGDKHFLPSRTVFGSLRRAGARCCWVCSSAASRGRRSWRWVTVRWASGRRCRRSIQRPAASAAGCTRPATSSTTSQSPRRTASATMHTSHLMPRAHQWSTSHPAASRSLSPMLPATGTQIISSIHRHAVPAASMATNRKSLRSTGLAEYSASVDRSLRAGPICPVL